MVGVYAQPIKVVLVFGACLLIEIDAKRVGLFSSSTCIGKLTIAEVTSLTLANVLSSVQLLTSHWSVSKIVGMSGLHDWIVVGIMAGFVVCCSILNLTAKIVVFLIIHQRVK